MHWALSLELLWLLVNTEKAAHATQGGGGGGCYIVWSATFPFGFHDTIYAWRWPRVCTKTRTSRLKLDLVYLQFRKIRYRSSIQQQKGRFVRLASKQIQLPKSLAGQLDNNNKRTD
jgi:hypothetical protein